jgi:hypothetical protein
MRKWPTGRWIASVLAAGALSLLAAVPAGTSSPHPSIHLSTTQLVPGKTLVITGSGWTHIASVNATICGANALSGTVDCAVTSTATMGATARGLLWSHIAIVIPPAPCPCVVQVSGTNITYTLKIPVTVVGAPTAPVRQASQERGPTLRITDFEVTGGATLASFFGGRAQRTIEFGLHNTWNHPVTPVLIGRWGKGQDLTNVIEMPHLKALGPGQRQEVKVPFSLTALSIGTYTVAVKVQLVGYTREFSAATATSQWPIGLLIIAALLILALAYLIAARRRRKRREAGQQAAGEAEEPVEGQGLPPGTDQAPQKDLAPA